MIQNLEELHEYVGKKEKIILYGAGGVGKALVHFFEKEHCANKIFAVTVTKRTGKENMLVNELYELKEYTEIPVILATKSGLWAELRETLSAFGFETIECMSDELCQTLMNEQDFDEKVESIKQGHALAKNIIPIGDETTHYFIAKWHIGDNARSLKFVRTFRDYYFGEENRTAERYVKNWRGGVKAVAITTKASAGEARLYPEIDEVVILSQQELEDLNMYATSKVCNYKNLHADVHDENWIKCGMYGVTSMAWNLNVPNDALIGEMALSKAGIEATKQEIVQQEIVCEKTVILCPHALSSTYLPWELWDRIVLEYKKKGYRVFTNVGPKETELAGTERLEVPVDVFAGLAQEGCEIIGLQCGLVDILLWSGIGKRIAILNCGKTEGDRGYAYSRGAAETITRMGNITYFFFQEEDIDTMWLVIKEYIEEM